MRTILLTSAALLTTAPAAIAGTPTFFNPLTQSAVVSAPDSLVENSSPWLAPAGVTQERLTSLAKVEASAAQSMVRVPGLGANQSMFDMLAFDDSGENLFIPHETQVGAGVTRYNLADDLAETLFSGDQGGAAEQPDWSNDYGAFDPATFTPNGTLLVGEEWSGQGRLFEVVNPHAPVSDIEVRQLHNIPNVSHEGLRFNRSGDALYFVDENNSGSLYKFSMKTPGDYTSGQIFVLSVDSFGADASLDWNDPALSNQRRTGAAHWVAMTDASGVALTTVDPFDNADRNGRFAADELGATPYGRPEDMEVGMLANGNEVIYFTATSEQAVYSIELNDWDEAYVRLFASDAETAKNLGFAPTSAKLNAPDNLAKDALGNIYIIEDAPNASATGGDIWFARDTDNDGVAESLDHFMSLQVAGSEATGMIFNPVKPTQFVVSVQHPSSTNLDEVVNGSGDSVWAFELGEVVAPPCKPNPSKPTGGSWGWKARVRACNPLTGSFVKALEKAGKPRRHEGRPGKGWRSAKH